MAEFLCILTPPRQPFVEDITDEEQEIMSRHFGYLQRLLAEGKLVLAGPSLGPVFGVSVFEADDIDEARRIVDADPAVSCGLQTAEVSPFRVSLLRGRD
jgi:uncharacterized protein YciI